MIRVSLPLTVLLNPGTGGNHSRIFDPCHNVPWPNFCVDGFADTAYSGLILAGSTFRYPQEHQHQ